MLCRLTHALPGVSHRLTLASDIERYLEQLPAHLAGPWRAAMQTAKIVTTAQRAMSRATDHLEAAVVAIQSDTEMQVDGTVVRRTPRVEPADPMDMLAGMRNAVEDVLLAQPGSALHQQQARARC